MRENLHTLYGAVDDGALEMVLPKFVRKELDGYLECGLLCRGFARLRCTETCKETRLVAFSCKGRGFCPSCLGRKMCATAAHLMDDVMPRAVPLRQWVLTMPFSWRKRLAYDGALWSALTRVFTKVVSRFYGKHGGAVIALQRTSSDMKLNPHVHAVFLDGHYVERTGELEFETRSRVSTSDVAHVLQHTRDKMFAHLRRRGMLAVDAENDNEMTPLAASAVAGTTPPAGPEWRRGKLPLTHQAMTVERPLCVALDGFTLHAATRAGAMDDAGRESLLKYILRPSVAQERVTRGPDGLVRIALKKAFADGTVAIDMDPLSLLSRLAASVPPPKFHTVHYSGVLASASKLRSRIAPKPLGALPPDTSQQDERPARRGAYRPWADLLRRTFGFDVLQCPNCKGRMRLLAIVTEPKSIARYLRSLGEPTSIPEPEPARGPPYWKSRILRRAALGDEAA